MFLFIGVVIKPTQKSAANYSSPVMQEKTYDWDNRGSEHLTNSVWDKHTFTILALNLPHYNGEEVFVPYACPYNGTGVFQEQCFVVFDKIAASNIVSSQLAIVKRYGE